MTINDYLRQGQAALESAGTATARLDVLVLMEYVTKIDRAQILAHPEIELSKEQQNVLNELVARRVQHEPIAYLLGMTEFYGREFVVSAAVLEPRPESEAMINLLKNYLASHPKLSLGSRPKDWEPGDQGSEDSLDSSLRWNASGKDAVRIADVGAGSGALGITTALEVPNAIVDLLDIDNKALEIAKSNVIKHTTDQNVIVSDLLEQAPHLYDILLCNLPYVPDDYAINEAAKHEPKIALFGGPDGLDLYRKLFDQIQNQAIRPLLILTESLPTQHLTLSTIARAFGYELEQTDDFIQLFQLQK